MVWATNFAFCFDMREGMLLFSGFMALSAAFWLGSISYTEALWPESDGFRLSSILLLLVNAGLGTAAARFSSEKAAFALVCTFGALVVCLTIDLGLNHPSSCASPPGDAPQSNLGHLVTRLLWTSDACLLMSILGWVTLAVGYGLGLYLWYMTLCFWKLLRAASADVRRVARAIAALPIIRYRNKEGRDAPLLPGGGEGEGGEGDGVEYGDNASCAICLSDFEEGEALRVLPCRHLFRKECIDEWVQRQGISASCPLCKHALVPRAADDAPADDDDAPADGAPASVEPLVASPAAAAADDGAGVGDLEAAAPPADGASTAEDAAGAPDDDDGDSDGSVQEI